MGLSFKTDQSDRTATFHCKTHVLLFLLCSTAAMNALATEPVKPAPQESDDSLKVLQHIDDSREFLSTQLIEFASEIDRFFGGERNFQESNRSVVQFDLVDTLEPGGRVKNIISGRAKIDLPATQQRLHLLVESDTKKDTPSLNGGAPPPTSNGVSTALRFERSAENHIAWHLSADTGMGIAGGQADPFFRTRASVGFTLGAWYAKIAESLFWYRKIGAGETTQIDFEHILDTGMLFRSTSIATWLRDTHSVDASQSFNYFRGYDDGRFILYQVSAVGRNLPRWQVTDYAITFSYRQRLHRDWLYGEVSPQLHYPLARQYRVSPAVVLRLEVLLGKPSDGN